MSSIIRHGHWSRIGVVVLCAAWAGCNWSDPLLDTAPDAGAPAAPAPDSAPLPDAPSAAVTAACAAPLVEDRAIYAVPWPAVVEISIQVDPQLLANIDADLPGAIAPAIFTEGTFGAGATSPNATLSVRGHTSRLALQKSYKLKLLSKTDLWRGQRQLDLNKHPYDLTRVRQTLAFTLFRSVPSFTSLRTQYVHLTINGADAGLFTEVEPPDQRFLASHGLDPAGSLYSPEAFSFQPITAATAADPLALAALIKSEENPDPEKLLRMVRDVNDPLLTSDEIIARHFDRENYLTWLALVVLLGDHDTVSQNFMLYSRPGCEKWFFLPWDLDGSLGWSEQPGNVPLPRWRNGLSNWWGSPLHRRFFQVPRNVTELRTVMDRLRATTLSDANVQAILTGNRDLVRGYVGVPPDVWNLPVLLGTGVDLTMAQWDAEYERLGGVVRGYDLDYTAVFARPMPVVTWQDPLQGFSFQWTPSYSLVGEGLTYDFVASSSPAFEPGTIVVEHDGLTGTQLPLALPPGTYYWRVLARGTSNRVDGWQISFNAAAPVVGL